MAVDISNEINTLRTATYGEEVRTSIADGMQKLQDAVNSGGGGGGSLALTSSLSAHGPVELTTGVAERSDI